MPEIRTLGEQVTHSSEYPRGPVSELFDYEFVIPLTGGFDVLRKGITNGGALVPPDQLPFVPPRRPQRLFDLILRTPTRSNTVFYIQQTSFTSTAAAVAEGARKPESSVTYEQRSTDVTIIATWIPVSNRMLADSAVLEAIIDSTLVHALDDELQRQIIQGNGAEPNLRGILNTSGISTYTRLAGDTMANAVRKAATVTILTGEVVPTGLVLHPTDLEALELAGSGGGGTFGGGGGTSTSAGASSMADVTVVQTVAIPQGTGLIGAFDVGCMLFDRQRGRVTRGLMDDGFVRNIELLRAELEAAFAVLRPAVFTRIVF